MGHSDDYFSLGVSFFKIPESLSPDCTISVIATSYFGAGISL